MSRKFLPFSTIKITHEFYTGGGFPELSLEPTADTIRLLKGFRMLFGTKDKSNRSAFQILRESIDGTNPLIDLPASYALRFAIRIANPNFENFTNLPPLPSGHIYLVKNDLGNPFLEVSTMRFVPGQLQLDLAAPGSVLVTAAVGGNSFTVDAVENQGVYSAMISLQDRAPGIYTLAYSGGPLIIYSDAQLYGSDVFGIMHLQEAGPDHVLDAYELGMKPKELKWRYFIRLKGDHSGWDYQISEPYGLDFDPYVFPVEPPLEPPQDVGNIIATFLEPGETLIGFMAVNEAAYQDIGRFAISLQRRKNTPPPPPNAVWTDVIKDLPNPGLGSATAAVVVTIDPPL